MAIMSKRAALPKILGYGEPASLFLGDMPADPHLRFTKCARNGPRARGGDKKLKKSGFGDPSKPPAP